MLVLHIGLPKTATSFLQHRIFKNSLHQTGHFIHRKYGSDFHALCKQFKGFVRAEKADTSTLLDRIVSSLIPLIDQITILTDENISIDSRLFWTGEGGSPKQVAERLGRIQDALKTQIRLIIGIRRPDQWLASRYAESSKKNSAFSQADFERRVADIVKNYRADTSYGWLDHEAVRTIFSRIFGSDQVFIYAIEQLADSPEEVLSAMGRFADGLDFVRCYQRLLDADENVFANKLSTDLNTWKLFGEDTRLRLSSTTQALILSRFPGGAQCNVRT